MEGGHEMFAQLLSAQKQFKIIAKIGYGLTSTVYHVQANTPLKGTGLALKLIQLAGKNLPEQQRLRFKYILQANLLRDLGRHPGIIQILEGSKLDSWMYLLLNYVPNGNIISFFDNLIISQNPAQNVRHRECPIAITKQISQKTHKFLFAQIVETLTFLDGKGVIHRDLKGENILLDKKLNIKLIDFETAFIIKGENSQFRDQTITANDRLNESNSYLVGTKNYVSPELIGGKSRRIISTKIDIWSLGVLAFRVLCGKFPFESETRQKQSQFVFFSKIRDQNPQYPEYLTGEQLQFLSGCLRKDPRERLSLQEIKKLSYFQNVDFSNIFNEINPVWQALRPEMFQSKWSYLNKGLKIVMKDFFNESQAKEEMIMDSEKKAAKNSKNKKNVIVGIHQRNAGQQLLEIIRIGKKKRKILAYQIGTFALEKISGKTLQIECLRKKQSCKLQFSSKEEMEKFMQSVADSTFTGDFLFDI